MGRWKLDTPGKKTAYMRDWGQTEAGLAYRERHAVYAREWRERNRGRFREKKLEADLAVRLECLQHYSGLSAPVCRCCGESGLDFLQIDHMDGHGKQHYQEMRKNHGSNLFYGLKKLGFPDNPRLQVLCANCNFGKGDRSFCPHELESGVSLDGGEATAASDAPKAVHAGRRRVDASELSQSRRNVYARDHKAKNAARVASNAKAARGRVKLEALLRYGHGSAKCRCCGESMLAFLHLDHVNGDGAEFRKKWKETRNSIAGGTLLYYWLKKNGWPDLGLQVLCANCNLGKRKKAHCPHELIRGHDLNGDSIPDAVRGKYAAQEHQSNGARLQIHG